MNGDPTTTLLGMLAAWTLFYTAIKVSKFERPGLEVSSFYALYKSTRLNNLIGRLGRWRPDLWRVLGNIGVAACVGQVAFVAYLLSNNLLSFIYKPEQATPVQPLIPGVTISVGSLPWFFMAAGVVILFHELSHGVQCVVEGVPVKSSAILYAVITFGGAVEPDEEVLNTKSAVSKMRIFAAGSLTNLLTGLLIVPIFIAFGGYIPLWLGVFLDWFYFLSINLAVMNMLPIGPLDGGLMWKAFTENIRQGEQLQKAASYIFLGLILGNIALSLTRFGLVPI